MTTKSTFTAAKSPEAGGLRVHKPSSNRRALVILDIDGTLCDSTACHERAFAAALLRLGISGDAMESTALLHYTDSWIFAELFSKTFSRSAKHSEISSFEKVFTELLQNEPHQKIPTEIAGVRHFLDKLVADQSTTVCFVTGSFAGAALAKLHTLGVTAEDFVLVTASDFESREDATRNAIEQAASKIPGGFKQIVSIGDGWWDFKTARILGLDFIAVNMAVDAREKLPSDVRTFENFSEVDEILDLIHQQ